MKKQSKILVTGATGLVGTALTKILREQGFENIIPVKRKECDLTDYTKTLLFFKTHQPDFVFHLAGCVHGILGNLHHRAESYLQNTLMNTHVVDAAHKINVKKIVAMGSGVVYPDLGEALLKENDLWSGPVHASEYSYGYAKRNLLVQLQAYYDSYQMPYAYIISSNLYGPNDRFHSTHGHVVPALVRRFHEARKNKTAVTVWGNGSAQRDFMYVDDMARALILTLQKHEGVINVGSGEICAIRKIVDVLAKHCNLEKSVQWDAEKPNGQLFRAYDLSQLKALGFQPSLSLEEGLIRTYEWFSQNEGQFRE
ncbi:MAG: NAD-dependent epimerase/dehydratase family protein [Gammaproteobacteria bacterium]